jgi:hypothetical protein
MRFTNRPARDVVYLYYAVCFLAIATDYIVSGLSGSIRDYFEHRRLLMFGLGGLTAITLVGAHYFEYDSDGEVLVFRSRPFILGLVFSGFTKIAEFPKPRLAGYKIKGFIRKELIVYVRSSHGGRARKRFNITFVGRSRRKNMIQSLEKVLKKNAENAQVNE